MFSPGSLDRRLQAALASENDIRLTKVSDVRNRRRYARPGYSRPNENRLAH